MSWYLYPLIVAAGLVAGFINTLAGSGSLITLPALIFSGLPATVANGTNRVAVVLQTLVAVRGFHSQGVLNRRWALWLAVPAALGAILGANLAVGLNETLMRRTIGALMIFMLLVMLVNPQRWIEGRSDQAQEKPRVRDLILFFFIGIYGGFITAGVGIFLLAGLVLGAGFDLIRGNAIKVFIVLLFTIPALIVFTLYQQVNWGLGLLLAIGNMSGAWLGAHAATRPGAGKWVHRLLIVVVLYSAIRLLGA